MDTIHLQFPWILIITGFVLSGCSLLYKIKVFKHLDHRLFTFLHLKLIGKISFFRKLWPMGKTPAMIAGLGILYLSGWVSGFMATLFFITIACVERLIKLKVKRKRPFYVIPKAGMFQPAQPYDPSFPSGDAMRIWYLTFVLPTAFALPLPFLFLFCLIALLVSLGRIAFGVHFPLDVIGGAGLGLIGAGFYQITVLHPFSNLLCRVIQP